MSTDMRWIIHIHRPCKHSHQSFPGSNHSLLSFTVTHHASARQVYPMATWIAVSLIFWTLFLIIFSTSTRCHMRMAWQEAQHGVSQANFRWSTDPSWIRDALPPESMLFHSSTTTNMQTPPCSGIPAAFCPVPCPHPRHHPLCALVQHPGHVACRTALPHQPHHSRAPECAPCL